MGSPLTFAVIGAGSVGGYYGARLAQAGHEVHFLLHSDFDHVARFGLRVDSVDGDFRLDAPLIHRSVDTIPPVDVVLVALKTTSNHLLADLLGPLVGSARAVVMLQNGLGVEERVAAMGDASGLTAGLAFICSTKPGPGHIRHIDYGALTLAPYLPSWRGEATFVDEVAAAFGAGGAEVTVVGDSVAARWRKLCWNVPFNGVCVLRNASTRELLAAPETRALTLGLMREVEVLAGADGRPLPAGFVDQMVAYTEQMTPYEPSMKIDFDAGRPLEVEYIYDNVVVRAAELGVPVPLTAEVAAGLHRLTGDER